jgi:hypothetical protein
VVTLYNWRKASQLQVEVVPESEKVPEGWNDTERLSLVLKTAGLNATELIGYCQKLGSYQQRVERWSRPSKWCNSGGAVSIRPINYPAKERNRVKSFIRDCVEHSLSCMTMSMDSWHAD